MQDSASFQLKATHAVSVAIIVFLLISNTHLNVLAETDESPVPPDPNSVTNQGYTILQKQGKFVAITTIDREVFAQSSHADQVLRRCIASLKASGGEILIAPGLFPFHKKVELESRTKITGSGRATTLKLARDNTDGVIFIATGKEEIVLSDFTCQGIPSTTVPGSAGIIIDNCGDCEITSVFARDFSSYGFWLRNKSFMCRLTNCTTAANGKAGYYLSMLVEDGRAGRDLPDILMGCTSYGDHGHGIESYRALCTDIIGCQVYMPEKDGFHLRNSSSILISGCRCYKGEGNGIYAEHTHELNVSGNIICLNRGHGIEMKHTLWAAITGNEFIDSESPRSRPRTNGIYLHTGSKGVQITGNTIFNWPEHLEMMYGIHETKGCESNIITGNFINRYQLEAVKSEGKGTLVANNAGRKQRIYLNNDDPLAPPPETPIPLAQDPLDRDRHDRTMIQQFLNATRR